jgi:DNA-binding NarL/FixJ family response regulator
VTMARVLIIDDHPVFRSGFMALLGQESWCASCAEAGTVEAARDIIPGFKPDLVILDLSLGDANALGFIREILALHEEARILVVSMHAEDIYAPRALKAGAKGYAMKSEPPERLLEAMKVVLSGKLFLSPAMQARLMEERFAPAASAKQGSGIEALSDRELEILNLIGKGFGAQEIASLLNISVKTFDTHREHIKSKLNLESAQALRRFALSMEQ